MTSNPPGCGAVAGSASSSSSRRVLIASWSQRDSERKNCSRWTAGCWAPTIGSCALWVQNISSIQVRRRACADLHAETAAPPDPATTITRPSTPRPRPASSRLHLQKPQLEGRNKARVLGPNATEVKGCVSWLRRHRVRGSRAGPVHLAAATEGSADRVPSLAAHLRRWAAYLDLHPIPCREWGPVGDGARSLTADQAKGCGTVEQTPDWQVPGYEDVAELGRGGFGRVVLARRLADGMPVAVKYLAARLVADPGFRADFQQEARMLAGLQSAHTVRLYEYVETGGEPVSGAAIVMEYVPGASLRKLLASAGAVAMPPQAALGILKGSLLGLGAAHGLGVVHRDYKPENVLVRPEGVSVLADFGIAVRAGDLAAGVVGTPPYMAPEQFAGASPSAAADVYAATAVFFECVTGRQPIHVESRDLDSWARAHRTERVPVEVAPASVQTLISRGLAKDPAQRPAQALAFAAELERVAVQAYGPDWERIGRQVLIGALSGLAATGVLLSLVPGLVGPAVPLPIPLPSPIPGMPGLPSPTLGQPAPNLPPPTPGTPPAPPAPGTPPAPGYPSAPQSPYPHPRPHVPRHHPWRLVRAKLVAGKAVAAATSAVV